MAATTAEVALVLRRAVLSSSLAVHPIGPVAALLASLLLATLFHFLLSGAFDHAANPAID